MSDRTKTIDAASRAVFAHAKVNLFLAVGGRRGDGFHEVTTVLQALELADEIEVSPSSTAETTLERDYDLGIPESDDLVFRAAEAWRAASGYDGGIRIRVAKCIPAGAGLGGGSADAAGVLAALASWGGTDAESDATIAGLAASLGADVRFFLGAGTRLMAGRGDEPVRAFGRPELHIALVNPGVATPTGAVYAQFDRMVAPAPPGPDAMIEALMQGSPRLIGDRLFNNMTEASCALVPEIRAALRFLENADGVLGSQMAGSGSTAFGIFDSEDCARGAALAAAERGWWSCATTTAARGVDVA